MHHFPGDAIGKAIPYGVYDMARKIRRYIRHDNKTATPMRWSYRTTAHRIGITPASTLH